MKIIDATFWTNHPDPMRPEIRGDRERYLAGERLHPELPEFTQGMFLQSDLMLDLAAPLGWLRKLQDAGQKVMATFDIEPEACATVMEYRQANMNAANAAAAAGVPSLNYDFIALGSAKYTHASWQAYRYTEKVLGWFDRVRFDKRDKSRSLIRMGLESVLRMRPDAAAWCNTHGPATYDSPAESLKDCRIKFRLLEELGVKTIILWAYRTDPFDANLPAFVAAREML